MNMDAETASQTWTWADQVSSYRFWGLLIFYVLAIGVADRAVLSFEAMLLTETARATPKDIGALISVRVVAMVFGFCMAWIAIKWRPVFSLILLGVLELIGLVLIMNNGSPLWLTFLGAALVGLATGAITLCVPAGIAGGRGGIEAFLVAFGIVTSVGLMAGLYVNPLVGKCIETWGLGCMLPITVASVVLGVLALLPVNRDLFLGQAPNRGYTLTPTRREPFAVALLFFVPFYAWYWLYRAHGEVAAVAPSRNLLSPRGALLGTIFVPFLYPVAMASLIEALNRQHLSRSQPRLHSPIAIFLWGFFLPPVAGGMIQSGLNKSGTNKSDESAASA